MLLLAAFLLMAGSAADDYATRICRKLASETEVRFVTDADVTISARTAGRIELSTGLFARLQNEAELAGVLAHQVAHMSAGTECIRFLHSEDKREEDRQQERAADEAAIPALIKAGYDPAAMLQFFSKYRREGADLPKAFSAEDLLIEKLQIEATDHPLKDALVNTSEFDRLRATVK